MLSEGRVSPGEGQKVKTGWTGWVEGGQPWTFMKEMSGDVFFPEGLTQLNKQVLENLIVFREKHVPE